MPFKPVQPGEPITDKWANALPQAIVQHLLEYALTSDGSILFNRLGADRISLSARRRGASSADFASFECLALGVTNGTARLRVKIGTINDRDEDSGLSVIGKTGTPPAGWWEFAMPASSTRYGMADATLLTDGTCSAAKFELLSTAPLTGAGDPDTGAPPPHAYRKLFRVVTDGNASATVTHYVTGAQQAFVTVSAWSCTEITKNAVWLP